MQAQTTHSEVRTQQQRDACDCTAAAAAAGERAAHDTFTAATVSLYPSARVFAIALCSQLAVYRATGCVTLACRAVEIC